MAGKRKKAARKKTRGAARKRVRKTPKKRVARGRRRAKKARAAGSRASKRMARRRRPAPQKRVVASSSAAVPAPAGELYGEADWRADDEAGRRLAPFNREEDPVRRVAEEDRAEETERGEEDAEW